MLSSSDRAPTALARFGFPPGLRLIISAAACVIALLLAWLMRHQTLVAPDPSAGIYVPSPIIGITLYSILFAVLSLLAYRLSPGVYLGFQHSAIVAAYLTLGAGPAVIANIFGAILAEVGRYFFARPLDLRPHTLRDAVETLLFNTGLHSLPTLLAALLYEKTGGMLPLLVTHSGYFLPVLVMLLASF